MNLKLTYILFLPLMLGCAKKKINSNIKTDYLRDASIEAEAGNFEKALELSNKAYKQDPTPRVAALKATVLYQLKKFDEAVVLFKKIIEDPQTPLHTRSDVKNNYAVALLCLGRKDEAKSMFKDLTFDKSYLSPEVAWFNLGLMEFSDALMELRELDKHKKDHSKILFANAIKFFEKAVDIACNYIDAYFYLALAHYQINKLEDAKENLLIILSKIPDHKPAQDFLSKLDDEMIKIKEIK